MKLTTSPLSLLRTSNHYIIFPTTRIGKDVNDYVDPDLVVKYETERQHEIVLRMVHERDKTCDNNYTCILAMKTTDGKSPTILTMLYPRPPQCYSEGPELIF